MSGKVKFIGVYDYTVLLTYMSLCSAVFGMIQAVKGNFSISVNCLLISGICDAFDGIVARSKKDRTVDEKAFGIQLDSLCDVVSFGVFPAFLCYFMGMNGMIGMFVVFFYCLCAVIRLAFFNVLEANRQKVESGCAKCYRGLPVTSISIIFPIVYIFSFIVEKHIFILMLHFMMSIVAFLFVYDFSVPKPDWKKILTGK